MVAAEEPAGPRRQVDRGGDEHDRGEGREGVADQGADPRPADTRRTPGAHVPEQRHQAERRRRSTARSTWWRRPCRGTGRRAAARAASRAPGRTGHRRHRRARPPAGPAPSRGRPRSAPNPASAQNISSGSSSAVRLCTYAQALDGEQQPGDAAEQRGAEQPAADASGHQHGQGAGQRHHEPPAERRERRTAARRSRSSTCRPAGGRRRTVAGPQPVRLPARILTFAGSGSPSLGALM